MTQSNENEAPTTNGAEKPAVKFRDFSLHYGKQLGVANVTVDIYAQSVTAIIGASGCGKSTLLRSVNRMNDLIPSARATGALLVHETDVYGRGIDLVTLRQTVGMVFQKPNPFPKSIYDNVAYGARLQGIRGTALKDVVEQSLRQAELWNEVKDVLRKPAFALSGGQQQRLCIARALAPKPEILLMDEPCSALDPISTAKIEELIKHLKQQYTVVIVTHNMQQALRVSDRTAFMHLGKLVEYDTTEVIFTNPREKDTKDYTSGNFG
ncbi:MAG: phosphate ABC transporter ATP-binding protein PstB [Gemmataceae bacterium]